MIDTHCHLTFPELKEQLSEVIDAATAAGVSRMITIGTSPVDAREAQAVAERFEQVYFAAGVHPHYIQRVERSEVAALRDIVEHERCVAFGEMGVDYHYDDPPREAQHDAFAAQLQIVADSGLDKPIVIHCRKAVDDTLAIIRASGIAGERFVFHCFTEPPEDAKKVLDLGAMISFTGIVTYKNAPEVRESAKLVPDERIMVETDAPYLSPEPHRKVRPNEPKFVPATAKYLANLRGTEPRDFESLTDANAERFFKLP
jgi:TatD DNase family protein